MPDVQNAAASAPTWLPRKSSIPVLEKLRLRLVFFTFVPNVGTDTNKKLEFFRITHAFPLFGIDIVKKLTKGNGE